MNTKQETLEGFDVAHCLRCERACRPGVQDKEGRAIVKARQGFCPNCMITKFFLSVNPIARLIEARGPEILLGGGNEYQNHFRSVVGRVLAHTQMTEPEIEWVEVVSNWGMPWPKGKGPQPGAAF